jgi:hypothetical protein
MCAIVVSTLVAAPASASSAQFLISPIAFDFGNVSLGATSPDQQVTVTNVSSSSVVVSMAGGAAGDFGGFQDCQGKTLAPGASCHITYQFTPPGLGPDTGSTSGSINGQPFSFSFQGKGVPTYRISGTRFDFGQVLVGTTSPDQQVEVTNIGTAAVTVSMAGGAGGDFGGFQDCQGKSLAPGASCHITYQFTPPGLGLDTGSTSGSINGQPFSFDFRGTGVAPVFDISPTRLAFGEVAVGSTSPDQQITVTNLTPSAVTVSMAGGAGGDFGGFQDCQGKSLATGASCHITYQFTPTALGADSGSTAGSINGQPFAFDFSGTGIETFRISPTGLDFGEVALGTTSPDQQIAVTNVGTSAVTVSMAGGAAGVFGGFQDCQGKSLAPGASCHITYQFTPSAPGPTTGSTSGSINGQNFSFSFKGTGTGDATPPVIVPSVSPSQPAPSGWYLVSPTVSFAVSDPESAITTETGCDPTTIASDTPPAGVVLTCSATSAGGTSSASVTIRRDATPPTLTCVGSSTFTLGATGTISATVTDASSGPAVASVSVAADTSSAGPKSATLTAMDVAGNTASVRCPYVVGFTFSGFLAPIRDEVRAGAILPLNFALLDAAGAPIADATASALAAGCAVTVTFSGGTPSPNCATYDPITHQFHFNLAISRGLAPGTYTVGVAVRVGGALVASGSATFAVR